MVSGIVRTLTVINGTGNLWWAGSLQRGIDWLKRKPADPNDVILMINDDVQFDPCFLGKAAKILHARDNILLLACFLNEKTSSHMETGIEANLRTLTFKVASSRDRINCLSTRGLFARWKDILRIGNFYPKLLPHYLSDYEYTIRARRKGLSLWTDPTLVLRPDSEQTGLHCFDHKDMRTFVREFFSKKSAANPIWWTSFVILACPKPWVPVNIARVWARAFLIIAKNIMLSAGVFAVQTGKPRK